jgi:hypothetical protein
MLKIQRLAGASCAAALVLAVHAHAGSMALQGDERWLTIASTKDKDTAIAIAGYYASERAKVVSTQSGWFAIVLGPYREGSIAAIKKAHEGIGEVPKDALLSRGDKYIDTVHEERPWDEQRLLATYELKKPVQFSSAPSPSRSA